MRVAKAKGRLRGKQPKLNVRQEAHLVALYRAGERSVAELGDLFGVTRSTVYRAIQRDAARQAAPGESRVHLAAGRHLIFERTGTQSGGGGFTLTRSHGITLSEDQDRRLGATVSQEIRLRDSARSNGGGSAPTILVRREPEHA
jgi:hypothetical protein